MTMTGGKALETLVAKEEIRELAMLYSRGVDRQDIPLLRTLYTADGMDHHGEFYSGDAKGFMELLKVSFRDLRYSGHHICNHLISVNGDEGEGEVYAIAYHIVPDGSGGYLEDVMTVRYLDRYRKEADGRWRFAVRTVAFDMSMRRPLPGIEGPKPAPADDASYAALTHRVFARGQRAED